jgi:glycosyltransferase involved in cell wall biosynthesis
VRTLLVMTMRPEALTDVTQQQREAADESPRLSLFEHTLNADVIDAHYLKTLPRIRRSLYNVLPVPLVQALEAFRQRNQYDVVVSWNDRSAILYSLLSKLTRSRARHVAILTWNASHKKALILNHLQAHCDRLVVWSQVHRELLVDIFGLEATRVTALPFFVDQQFWRPLPCRLDSICSAGDSRRDYRTLVEAVRDLPITCRIATRMRPSRQTDITTDWRITADNLAGVAALPPNVTISPAAHLELREIYARSHFVVVPVFRGFRDHGITTCAEAMAMGKAVICSRNHGQIDLVEDGENGILVPPGDSQALRKAILYLLEHPDVAARMGAEGRWRAENILSLDQFVGNVRCIVEDVIRGTQTPFLAADEAIRVFKSTGGKHVQGVYAT